MGRIGARDHGVSSGSVMSTGVRRGVNVPSPSWPSSLLPQQARRLSEVMAHVCDPPADSALRASPPLTGVGATRVVVEPSPSWPRPLSPQQYATPTFVRPHV